MGEPPREDVERVVLCLARISESMRRGQGRVIDPTRQAIMQAAATRGSVRPTDLARELSLVPSSITRQVRALEDAGHVQVEADAQDRRACLVSLTDAGWAEAVRLTEQGVDAVAALVADWDPGEVSELGRLLAKLEDAGLAARDRQERARAGRPWQRVADPSPEEI